MATASSQINATRLVRHYVAIKPRGGSAMCRPFLAVALVLGFFPIATFPAGHGQQSAPAALLLASSKTICVVATDADLQTAIAERLVEWGRLTVVRSPDQADLVLHVSEKEPFKAYSEIRPDDPPGRRWAVRVTHRATARELWSATKGDGTWGEAGTAGFAERATAWRAREITKDFEKYFNKAMRNARTRLSAPGQAARALGRRSTSGTAGLGQQAADSAAQSFG